MDPDPGSLAILLQVNATLFASSEIILLEGGLSAYALFGLSWGLLLPVAAALRILRTLTSSLYETIRDTESRKFQRIIGLFEIRDSLRLALHGLQSLLLVALVLSGVAVIHPLSELLTTYFWLQLLITLPLVSLFLLTALYAGPLTIETRFSISYLGVISPFLRFIHVLSAPITAPLARWLRRQLSYGRVAPHLHSAENLKALADLGEAQGTIEEDEREFIHSIFEFGDTTVREVMISRLDINAISTESTLENALQVIHDSGHSRLPLYDAHLDNIIGIVHAKDLLLHLGTLDADSIPDWRSLARPALFVSEGKLLDDLLTELKEQKTHLAIVVDKYGGTAGLATMEDVLEEIVGDILDEYDVHEEEWHTQLGPNIYEVDARMDLDDLNDLLKIELETEKFDFDTLGGLIFHLRGDIPSKGDVVEYDPISIRIESVENHRIGRVRIRISHPQEATSAT